MAIYKYNLNGLTQTYLQICPIHPVLIGSSLSVSHQVFFIRFSSDFLHSVLTGSSSSGSDSIRRDWNPKKLLGQSNSDNRLLPKLDTCLKDKGVATQTLFRVETKSCTPSGVRQHCICACTEGKTEEVKRERGKVHSCRLLKWIERLCVITPDWRPSELAHMSFSMNWHPGTSLHPSQIVRLPSDKWSEFRLVQPEWSTWWWANR